MKQIPINSEDTVDNNNVPITGPKKQPGSNAVGPRASAGACSMHCPTRGEAWHRRIMYSDYRPCGCAEYYISPRRIINLNKLLRACSVIIMTIEAVRSGKPTTLLSRHVAADSSRSHRFPTSTLHTECSSPYPTQTKHSGTRRLD